MLLQRLVADFEVDAEGRLRPHAGAAWRLEPAGGEVAIHRRLASLVNAPQWRIAEFASRYGLLRRQRLPILEPPGPDSRAATAALGQEALDELVRVEAWIDAGMRGDPPDGVDATLLTINLYARLPEAFYDYLEPVMRGSTPETPGRAADFYAAALPSVVIASKAAAANAHNPATPDDLRPEQLRRAARLFEWVYRAIAELDDAPTSLAQIGGADTFLRQVLAVIPEAFIVPELIDGPDGPATRFLQSFAAETVDDWREAAAAMANTVSAIDLVRQAGRGPGLNPSQKDELAAIYSGLAGFHSRSGLSAAEIAERAAPLLARKIERQLVDLEAWPVRPGAPWGLYVRAITAAWTDLRGSAPPAGCATPGCPHEVPNTRNRLYCDSCQLARRREAVRRTRARSERRARSR